MRNYFRIISIFIFINSFKLCVSQCKFVSCNSVLIVSLDKINSIIDTENVLSSFSLTISDVAVLRLRKELDLYQRSSIFLIDDEYKTMGTSSEVKDLRYQMSELLKTSESPSRSNSIKKLWRKYNAKNFVGVYGIISDTNIPDEDANKLQHVNKKTYWPFLNKLLEKYDVIKDQLYCFKDDHSVTVMYNPSETSSSIKTDIREIDFKNLYVFLQINMHDQSYIDLDLKSISGSVTLDGHKMYFSHDNELFMDVQGTKSCDYAINSSHKNTLITKFRKLKTSLITQDKMRHRKEGVKSWLN